MKYTVVHWKSVYQWSKSALLATDLSEKFVVTFKLQFLAPVEYDLYEFISYLVCEVE